MNSSITDIGTIFFSFFRLEYETSTIGGGRYWEAFSADIAFVE
jgi:hypothetical protein